MRIAFFADIHANREALEACLHHAQLHRTDQYVFLGDLTGYGADPEYVLDIVMSYCEKGAVAVLGNHDEAVVLHGSKNGMHADAKYAVEWTRARLDSKQIKFLAGLPLRVKESDRLYVHANAWDPGGWNYITAAFEAGRSLAFTTCRLTFCGHVHEPCLYHQGHTGRVEAFTPVAGVSIPLNSRRWLINAGSVGQPRDSNPAACYVIYDSKKNMLTYFRVPFDVEAAAGKIRNAGLPEWFGLRLERGV